MKNFSHLKDLKNQSIKILVYAPNWVGDHAMAFPFYAALRTLFPQARLDLIGRSWIADLRPDGFERVVAFQGKSPAKEISDDLKKTHYDLAFTLSPSFRSAWLLYKSQAKIRIGFNTDHRGFLLSKISGHHLNPPYYRFEHRALSYLRLLSGFFENNANAEHLFQKFSPAILKPKANAHSVKNRTQKNIVVAPGSTAETKKYPIEHWINCLTVLLDSNRKLRITIVGAKIDLAMASAIENRLASKYPERILNLCAKTSLSEVHAFIHNSSCVISNDSGIAHVAALTPTPIVVFSGMGRRSETSPLANKLMVHDLNLTCSPCFRKVCPRRDAPLECLTGINPRVVAESVLKISR